MDWRPTLPRSGALHERIAAAIRRDRESGVLAPGQRLPPQRILAERLRISVGTVTKAFQEAERLGLVTGEVGRGTYVTGSTAKTADAATRMIDLSVNITPLETANLRLADSLRRLQRRGPIGQLLAYAPAPGYDSHRKAAATWLARTARFASVDWNRLIITAGGQQAMSLACAALRAPGDVIFCEAATYYGMKALAEHAGFRLQGLAMDDEGIMPDALDRAAAKAGGGVAYLMPTVQVPTARTMSGQRRRDIVKIARRRGLFIIEDDSYAPFASAGDTALAPLAEIAPELCVYISTVSKSLSPGLRTGFLVAPTPDLFERVLRILRSTAYANSSFGAAVMRQWVEDGTAFEIVADMIAEMSARWRMAVAALGNSADGKSGVSPHLWLQLSELDTERVASRAQRAGVVVTPPELPLLAPGLISGLRLCLGTPATRADLSLGLDRIRAALSGSPAGASVARI